MVTSLLLGMVFTSAVQDSAILHNTFDRGVEGWAAMQVNGAGAKVDATYDKVHLKSGPGSLDYSYKIANGEMSLAALQVAPGKLAKMNSLHFWLNCDHESTIVVSLSEHDGGRYSAVCHVPKAHWQEVNLSPSDFILATEPDAPKDPDGKLDVDKVESIALIDAKFDQVTHCRFNSRMSLTGSLSLPSFKALSIICQFSKHSLDLWNFAFFVHRAVEN